MLRHLLKTAFRNLRSNKSHSFINIGGLAVGMAVALLIGLWIWDELSFDSNNVDHDRIARVMQNISANGEIQTWGTTPFLTADELRNQYGSNFKEVVMGTDPQRHLLNDGKKPIIQTGGYWEPGAPGILDLHMIRGTRASLRDPDAILLSASVAKAYFGDADPINQVIHIDKDMLARVTGVYDDIPSNSTFADLHFIASWQLLYNAWGLATRQNPWRLSAFTTLVVLNDNVDIHHVSTRIANAKLLHISGSADALSKPQFWLHPMNQWRLYSEFKNGASIGGAIKFVWLFGTIGVFILLLACINFMNLSTARSEKRAREVGIRKAIGSLRRQLIAQFFSESLLVATIAFAMALLLAGVLLPFFNEVANKKMTMPWDQPLFWIIGLLFTAFTGLIAGSYPALYLSSFRPVRVLKGVFKAGPAAVNFVGAASPRSFLVRNLRLLAQPRLPRRLLTVLQFTVSVILIIGTIVVFRQIRFAQDRPLGYSTNGLVSIHMITGAIHDHFDAVKHELQQAGAIQNMTEGESSPTDGGAGSSDFVWAGKDPALATSFPTNAVAYGYGKTVGWQIDQGRDFSVDYPTDTAAFIVNEAAIRYMGLKNPIGQAIRWQGRPYHIVGVVRDMIVGSPYDAVIPFFYYINDYSRGTVIFRLNPSASAKQSLATIAALFSKYAPEQPFNIHFADDEYARKFGAEQRIGKLAGFFAILAIFISCLGLFGMASFVAEQRTKEIGIRKVLGATVSNLWGLLSREFVILSGISLVIAIPVATYFMDHWLQQYAYRAALSWWIFAATALGTLLITLLTVSWHSIRAALANPVRSLHSE